MDELRDRATTYATTVGSDVNRDGFYAELTRKTPGAPILVAEVFWSDETQDFFFTAFENPIPISVLESFLAEARLRVPPQNAPKEINFFSQGCKRGDA